MPYIPDDDRAEIDFGLRRAAGFIDTDGELNYAITQLCRTRLNRLGMSYANAARVLVALEAAKLEFYRRVMAPYEDEKCDENGDVTGWRDEA